MALKETPVDYDPFAVTSPPMAAKGYREIPVDYDPFAAKPATVAKPAVLPPPSMDTAVPVGLEAGNLTNYDIENALALDAAATAAGRENAANMGIISGADAIAGTRPPKPLPVLPPSRATRERERQLFDSQYSRDQVEKIIGSEFIGKEKVVLAAYEERLKQLQSGFKTAAAAGDRDAATRFQEEAQAIIPEYQAAIGRFNATVQSLREGAPLYTSEFSDPWPTVLAKTGKAFFPRVGQGLAALFGALEETSPNRELFEKHGAGSTGMAAAKTWGQIAEEASPVVVPGTPKAWVSGALESVALNAPMALAGMASGSLALPLVGMGLIAGGQKYAELREKRPDIAIPLALSVAAGSGTMEGLTELIPLKTLLRTDIGIGKKLVNEMFQEIPTEMANTIYADLQDKMTTRPNMTWGDFLQDEIDTIMTTAIATPIMVGSTHKAVKYLERKRKEAIEADQKRIETYAKDVMADEAKLKQFKENLGIKDEGQPPEGPSASGPSSARPQPPPPVMPPPAAPAPSEPPLAMPPPSVPPRPVLPDGWLANRAGYPYKTEKSATEAMAKKGLAETHEVVAYENGFALKPKEEPVKATEEKTEEEVPPPPEIVQNAPTSQAEGTKYPVSGVKLYHSSDVPILDINPELYGSKTDEGLLGKGFYLSTDKNIGQGKGITSEFETSIESPLVVEYPEWGSDKAKLVSDAIGIDRASGEQLTKELISRGYDSVVLDYAPVGYDHKEVAIFDKAKLKPTSIVGEAPPSRRPVLPPPTKVSGEAGKPSTKTFVENKIRQLGSIEAVNAFYSGDDAISQYARQEAPKILGIKEKEPTTATKKEKKLPYGRSGVSVFKKIAATANLSEENSPDYDDFVSFFEQYYNAGVSGKDMPAIDMHPQDAHAAYQAGRDDAERDREAAPAKKPVMPPPKKAEAATKKPVMPPPKAKTETLVGKNADGEDIYEDQNGVRYVIENGIKLSESVKMVPTRGGIVAQTPFPRDERYKTVEGAGLKQAKAEESGKDQEKTARFAKGDKVTVQHGDKTYPAIIAKGGGAGFYAVIPDLTTKQAAELGLGSIMEVTADRVSARAEDADTKELKAAIEVAQTAPREFDHEDPLTNLIGGEKYPRRFRDSIRDINFILDDRPDLKSLIPNDLWKYLDENRSEKRAPAEAKKPFFVETGIDMKGGKLVLHETPKPFGSENKIFTEDKANKAREILRKKLGALNMGVPLDPEIIQAGIDLAGYYIEGGSRTFVDYSTKMITDLGDVVRPYLKSFYMAVRNYPGFDKTGMNNEAEVDKIDENSIDIGKEKATLESKGGEEDAVRGSSESAQRPVVDGSSRLDVEESPGKNEGSVLDGEVKGVSRPEGSQGAIKVGQPGGEGATEGTGNRSDREEPDHAAGRAGNERQPAGTATGATPEENSGMGGERLPRRESKGQNHRIGPDDTIYHSGKVSRINANIRAIQTLKKLEKENRPATNDEKKILAQFTGWGAVAQDVFNLKFDDYVRNNKGKKGRFWDDTPGSWKQIDREYKPSDIFSGKELEKYEEWESKYGSKLHPALNGLLSEEEWKAAQDSALNAHYTDRGVIEAMWSIAERLGFKGGKVLEPGAGVGHFFGLMPENLLKDSKLSGVELDPITGRILGKLYPDADIQVTGFEDAKRINDNSFDLVISNFPFGNYPVTDKKHPAYSGWSVHNYFFARSLDAVKPGGLVISVTSHYSMDTTKDGKIREYLAGKADLVGAIRLPGTAFEKNAGTSVTTDILIFRKKTGADYPNPQNWRLVLPVKSIEGDAVKVNEYFINNPKMVMGQHSSKGSMHAGKKEYTLLPSSEGTLKEQIEKAADLLPRNIMETSKPSLAETQAEEIRATDAHKEGTFAVHKGKVYMVHNGALSQVEFAGDAKKMTQALAYVGVRDSRTALIDLMRSELATDDEIAAAQAELSKLYDAYVKKYGNFHKRAKDAFLEEDEDFPTVLSLETVDRYYVAGVKTPFTKILKDDIFTTRTVFPFVEPKTAENVEDAVRLSVTYRNGVDLEYVSSLLNITKDDAKAKLLESELAYEDPATGIIESKEAYLSGNVREKLKIAELRGFDKNVEALKKVLPAFKYIDEVHYKIGSEWMPPDIIDAFIRDVMGVETETIRSAVELSDDASTCWRIGTSWSLDRSSSVYTQWGAEGLSGIDLVEDALNLRRPEIFDYYEDENGNEKRTKNNEKTLVAQQKQKEIVGYWEGDRLVPGAFRDYVMQHPEHITRIEQVFNEKANNYVVRQYEVPSFEHFPNASHAIKLRPHQMRAVIRGLIDKGVIYAHAVGTGKTYMYASLAMELKRIKRARKPMVVVQGSTLKQFAAQAHKLYPTARILTLAKEEIAGPTKRQAMMAKVANGNWDMVIIAHSTFNRISMDAAREAAFIEEQLEEIEAAIRQEGGDIDKAKRDDPPTVKELRKLLKRKRERLKKLADRSQDNAVTFESLGVDALLIDEAHTYKRGDFFTKMGNIRGLDRGAAQKSFDFMMKCRYVQEKTRGKNVYLATGTPVSNTIAEVWTLLRYARPELLKEYGVSQFDGFASLFGDTRVAIEPTETGEYKVIERFNKYSNGVQLINMWLSGADVILQEDVPGWSDMVPKLKNGEFTKVSLPRPKSLDAFIEDIRRRKQEWEDLEGKEKMAQRHVPIVLYGEAKKGSIDLRLVHPQNIDDPGSKVNKAVELAFKKWQDTKEDKGAQLIFCDLYQSPDPDAKKWINNENHSLGKIHVNPHLRGIPRFNLYEDIKKKLVSKGIPEAEIAIINESKYSSDSAKERLFERVNDGAVRILLGSTEKLGVGVNVQERLAHVIHIDAPPRPMDFEQRNGRIIRPGNGFKEVEVTLLATVNSMDEVTYNRLQKKQKFTNQLLRGNIPGNNFEDPSDQVQMTLEQMIAVASGNPLVMKQYELENNIRELETLKHGYEQKKGRLRHDIYRTEEDISRLKEHLSKTERKVVELKKAFEKTGTFQIKIGNKEYDTEADGVEALTEHIEEVKGKVEKLYNNKLEEIKKELAARLEAAKDLKTGKGEKVSGVNLTKVQEVLRAISFQGGKDIWMNGIRLTIVVSPEGPSLAGRWNLATLADFENEANVAATYYYGDYFNNPWGAAYKTAKGILNSIQKKIAELYEYPAEIKNDIEKKRKNKADMEEEIKKDFPHTERLENLRKEYADVLSQLGTAGTTDVQADDEIEIPIEETPASEKFYVRFDGKYKEVTGEPIDNDFGLSLFACKPSKDNHWGVFERSTGIAVAYAEKKIMAIENAFAAIEKQGIKKVKKKIQEAIGEKGLTPWGEATKAAEKETAAEDLDALRAIAKESWEDYQDRGGKDEFPIWEAKVARAEAILSQYGEGNIDTAQNMLDEAKHRWKMDWEVENDEYYPEGQSYPQEILTAQHVITSIRQGQGKLFKGDKDASLTLYGGLFPDPIAAAKAFRAVADDIKAAIPRLEALGKAVFDAGKQTYEDWTRAMKRHLGELWAKFKGYLEDIWKNAKAMNQRQKFKKLFDKKDKERGSISFKKKTVLPQPGHKFESPETEALFQSAKGIKKETVIEKIKAVATEIGHKIARDYEHLANSRQNAPLIFILKRLEKQRDVVADRTAREIGKVLSGLDKSEYDIFARKVILDDLLADVERGKYDNEKELPFKFTAESLAAEKERLDALVDENPKIAAALAKRKAMWEVVKGEYIDALKPYKANVEDMFKENYYRHQVLDYVESNGIFGTGSKRLAFPVSRGYTKERTGYAGLYNTDYLEAEHNIMAQMLYDIEMAEALTGIKSEEDISAQVKAKAKEKNFENLVGGPKNLSEIRKLEGQLAELRESGSMDSEDKKIAKGIIERLNELDPTRPFKQKIAMSFAKLRKLGVIDDTDIDYGGDLPGGIFSKLSELINEEGPWQKPIATIFKAIRERENLMRQTLGAKYLEWQHGIDKRAIPPGYTAWQPREGNVFYPVLTVDEKTAAAIMAGELDKLAPGSGDLFKKAMAVGGKRTQWIVRDEVAETLNNLTRERAKGIISSVDLKVMVAWKKWQLISPRRMIKYNIRNLTGDAEATFLGNPAGFGYVPQAIRELYAVFVGKQPMSADMLAWFTRGGMSSTLQAQEMDALKQAWMFTKLHDKEAGFLKNAWQKYWKVARLSTDFRESILRYASFLSYKEQLKKNGGKRPDNYGASKPETIDALDNIDDKAFWLSNDLLGAYDRVSVFGQWIRERAIPFWSWQEVNMKRYVQLFRNAADNGELATAIGKKAGITSLYAARKVGGFLIKAAAFAAILAVYNNLFWPDEEEKLPWDVRMRAHIILGKDADGNIEYFSRMGTLDDFLSWFGLDYIPKSLNDLLSGKSIKDVASAQAVKSLQAAPNKAVQGAVPFSKLGFELITRRSTFPDIFRPGAIRDRYLHIARSFGLENEYIALAGKPSRGYGESLNSLFMYKVDPNEADYRKAFDLKRDFLKKMGKEVDGFWITPDGDALYNMRLAMRYDDREAFRKYFMEYVERKIREGKDDAQIEQGIKRSLKSMHPVSGMSRGMQEAFARSLTDEEMKIMHGAVRFYYDVLEMGDNDDEERR